MARTLGETIKSNLQTMQQPQASDEGMAAQRLLRGKTGKAITPDGIRPSALAEQQQVAQTGQQLKEVAQTGQMQAGAIEQQERGEAQQQELAQKDIEQRREQMSQQFEQQSTQLLNELERSGKELDVQKDAAKIEQLGFMHGMQDKAYIDKLQNEGRKRRLDDNIEFKIALQESVFSDMLALFEDDIRFKNIMDADERDFAREISNIKAEDFLQAYKSETKAANQRSWWEGIGGIVSGGTKMYSAVKAK